MTENYELTCLLSPDLTETEKEKTIQEIRQLIEKAGGVDINPSPVNKVSLGYAIKNQNKAQLTILDFKLKGENVAPLKKELTDVQGLLRFFLIKKELGPKPLKPQRPSKKAPSKPFQKIQLKDIDKRIEEILKPTEEASKDVFSVEDKNYESK